MTPRDDFDLLMTEWMASSAPSREPDHLLEAVLDRTARTRRRPAWQFAERWLPMQLTLRRVYAPRGATLLVVLALIVALAVAALIAIGSRPRLPAPFGPAKNGLVAFDNGGQIFVANADGTGQTRPIAGSSGQFALWSHDGSKLAFLRAPNNVPPFSLWVVNADGSGLVNLTGDMPIDPPGDPTTVSWAPDGGSMAFASLVSGKGLKLFYVRSDGTSLHRLLESDLSVQQPVWSPDGATIVFKGSLSGAKLGLYSINADGSGLRLLTRAQGDTAYSFTFPQWSPDERRLLYYADGGDHDIWVVNADGSDEQNLTSGSEADNYWPAWSPDGSRIAYQGRDGNRTVDVVVMDADGSHPRTLSKQGFDINPMPISWSPDGTQILVSACIADSPICSTNYVADFAIAVDALGLKPPQQIATISGLGRNLSWQRVAP